MKEQVQRRSQRDEPWFVKSWKTILDTYLVGEVPEGFAISWRRSERCEDEVPNPTIPCGPNPMRLICLFPNQFQTRSRLG
jgi:hypothetical protein